MKRETTERKLNEILGITEVAQEIKKKTEAKKGNIIGITDEEIEEFRAREAVMYFLQAPELFHARVCKRCETPFLVSRLHVAYCSYECIRRSMREQWGIEWKKGRDLEAVAMEVYEGNEPLWIRNLSTLQKALTVLTRMAENPSALESLPAKLSPLVESGPSEPKPQVSVRNIPIPKL